MPAYNPADFEIIDEGYDPRQFNPIDFEVISEYPQYDQQPAPYRNDYRESGDALRLRQQFQREQEQQPDESTYWERLALGAGQGVRGLESSLGGLFNLAGLTGIGRPLQANARAGMAELQDTSATLAGQNPDLASEWVEQFGSMATQQVPSVAAAALSRGNRFVPAAIAGLQSAGSVQDTAEQAYEAQGLSQDEATNRAKLPAIASGAITGALTALMPGGTERLAGMMFAGPSGVRAAREGVYGIARRIFGEAVREAPEEMIDQLGQAAVARFSYDPEKPLNEILMETWEAGGWGVGTAGAVGTIGEVVNRAAASRPEETGMNLRQPPPLPPMIPPEPPLTQQDIDQANRINAIAQLSRAENERLGRSADEFDPSQFEVVSEPASPRGSSPRETPRKAGQSDNPAFSLAVNPAETPEARQLREEKTRIVAKAAEAPKQSSFAVAPTDATPLHDDTIRRKKYPREWNEGLTDYLKRISLIKHKELIEKASSEGIPPPKEVMEQLDRIINPQPETRPVRRRYSRYNVGQDTLPEKPAIGMKTRPLQEVVYRGERGTAPGKHIGISVTTRIDVAESYGQVTEYALQASDVLRYDERISREELLDRGMSSEMEVGQNPTGEEVVAAVDKWLKQNGDSSPKGVGEYLLRLGWQAYKMAQQSFVFDPSILHSKNASFVESSTVDQSLNIDQSRQEKVRIVTKAAEAWAAMQGVPFQFTITPAVDQNGELTEMGARIGNLIEVAANADEKVFPHELNHIAYEGLPAEVKAQIESARRAAVTAGMDPRLSSGQMTSEEFQAAGFPIEHYPLSSPSEFLADLFSNKFSQQALAKADPTLLGKLKVWLAELWRTLKRTLGLGNQMDRVVQDLIDGRLKFDPAVAAQNESKVRQATFVMSAEESTNAANLAYSALEQQIEGESQLAQASDITDVLDQFSVGSLASAIRKAFDYSNWEFIRNTGEALNQSRENYQQMKARLAADPFRRARLAGEAGQSILRFDEILEQVLADGSKAFLRMNSRTFQDFIARVQAKAATAQAQQAILTISKSTFDSAIKEASAALKQEARTDMDMNVLQGEIRGIREAAESTVAMEQTLNDMVAVLSASPEGQNALFTGQGGPRAILDIYRDLKRSAKQPVTNENLLKWAGYILARSPKLAAKIQAANLAKQTGLRAQLNGMARQLANDFSKDPVATVRRSLRERERNVRNAMSAEFAFRQLEEDFLSEFEPLVAAVEAGGIAANIKADPAFQALRREILNDQTSWGGSPDPAKAMRKTGEAGSTITLPVVPGIAGAPPMPMSGATIGIGHDVLDGNTNNLRARWDEYRKAITFLENWLSNPLNADDPMRRYHAHSLDTLKNYYAGQQHLMPENQSPLWNQSYSIISAAVSKSGSRLVGQARSVLNRADQMHKWSRDWFDRTVHALPPTQRAAITSHGIKWNDLRGQSSIQANRIYQQKVGQELAASWARQQGGYDVGDTISSGEVVTSEDMAHLEAQAKAGFEALGLAAKFDEQITKDSRGFKDKNRTNYRSALRTSPYLLPRMFDYTLQAKALAVSKAFKSEPAGAPRTVLEQALNQLWPQIGQSLLVDRNAEFSKKIIFDGKGNAFEVVANVMRGNPNSVPDVAALANELAAASTMTVDQAKEIVLDEFGRIVSQWSTVVEEKVEAAKSGGKSGDAKNSFTQARGDALAPWTFYRTGFTTTDDISNHAAGMQSVALDRVTATLDAIDADLKRQEDDLDSKARELERIGTPNAVRSAVELKEIERRRGQTYDSWDNLKSRRGNIQEILKSLKNPTVSTSDFDQLFNRGAGALVGAVIGNTLTTLKNISSIFLGRQLRAAGMDEFNSALRSALFTKAEAGKIILSLGWGGVRSVGYFVRGMARGVPQLLQGNARQAYLSVLRDVIRELSQNVPRRLQSVRDMEAAGVYQLPDAVAKFDNQILGSILYRGGIPANEFHGAAKIGGYAAGMFEATLLAVANSAFPTIGDAAVNGAMFNAVNSSFGPVQGMEDSLRKLYAEWIKGGLPRTFNLADPADPVNRLSPKELGATRVTGFTEQSLSQVRRTYQLAGMSFDERAATFLRDLQTNPKAQFLTPENRQALTDTLINKMNRSSFSNAPLRFKDGSFLSNMVRPLYGWSLRSFADWEQSMAIPTNTETGRMKLWATSMALAAVALAMTGAGGQLQDELMARLLKRGLYSQESANRLPWEETTTGRQIANWTRLSMESVPLLGIVGNILIPANNPARASYEPTIFLWESGKALVGWVHGMVASGDPFYGLPELLSRFAPDSKAILNRLPAIEGRRAGNNAVADFKRFAKPDLVRPPYRGMVSGFVTEATPWKQKMDNEGFRGNIPGFQRAANEALQVNLRAGMNPKDAKDAVKGYWRSRNPETRALTRRQTPQEYAEMLSRARSVGKDHAAEIIANKQAWARAGATIGVSQRQGGTNRVNLRAPSLSSRRGMARY